MSPIFLAKAKVMRRRAAVNLEIDFLHVMLFEDADPTDFALAQV
jgi:hypothetical protein